MSRIKHPDDARFGQIRALGARKERDRAGLFFVEGLRFVGQALTAGAPIKTVLTVPKLLAHKMLRTLEQRKVPIMEVTPEVFLSHSHAEEPQWIGAIIAQRWEPLPEMSVSRGLCWLAYDTVHSPGNLGTILRTSDAVGASGLILVGPNVDPYDPACVRATMGAIFAQRLVRATEREFADWKRRQRCTLIGTSPHAPMDYQTLRYPEGLVLWMGGERKGLSESQQAACDGMVRIPMVSSSDSLNLAVATSVMLYEVFNQRRQIASLPPVNCASPAGPCRTG